MSATTSLGLEALVAPRSIAIVGATGKPGSLFARPIEYMRRSGYAGALYPVNPKYAEIDGLPCAPSLAAIDGPVDLVLVLVPAAHVVGVIEEAGAIGAQAAIVFSSGFAEVGPAGLELQHRLTEVARRTGVRVVGPNCQGIIYSATGLAATFTGSIVNGLPPVSGLAYVGQSGAVGGCVMDLARDRGVGVGAWISVGNQADLDLFEAASTLVERDDVQVLAVYVESVEHGGHFVQLAARAAQLGKPLVLLRSGQTDSGRRAAVSHTGGLLGPGAAFEAVARRHGAIVVDEVDELVDVACALLRFGRGHGRAIGIATASGGAGSIAADQMSLAGLEVPELPAALQRRLAEIVPDFGAVANPVDATFQLFTSTDATFADIGRTLADEPAIDQVVMVMGAIGGPKAAEVAHDVVALVEDVAAPVHYAYLVGHEETADARAALKHGGVTAYANLGRVARVARALTVVPRLLDAPLDPPADPRFDAIEGPLLAEAASLTVLDAAGVPRARSELVVAAAQAPAAVARLGGRVVAKVQSPAILHKSDRGLVRLGVTADDAEATVAELLAAVAGEAVDGVLLQEQVPPGLELLVGVTRERPDLPALLTVGIGGVFTEVFGDTVTEALPLTAPDVAAMLEQLRGSVLLHGFRGAPAADVPAAVDAIVRIAAAAELLADRLVELEVNPLIVQPLGAGAGVVDALMRVRPPIDTREQTWDESRNPHAGASPATS
jgi:acyl-CoA synthetase (NDP forming)